MCLLHGPVPCGVESRSVLLVFRYVLSLIWLFATELLFVDFLEVGE